VRAADPAGHELGFHEEFEDGFGAGGDEGLPLDRILFSGHACSIRAPVPVLLKSTGRSRLSSQNKSNSARSCSSLKTWIFQILVNQAR
jgi:hypothetical protein